MLKNEPFIHKVLKHIDRLDRDSLKGHVQELVKQNALYEEILEHLQEGVLLVGANEQLRYANRQACLWLGLSTPSAHRGRMTNLVSDTDLGKFISRHLNNLQEQVVADFEILAPRETHLRVFLIPLESSPAEKRTLILLLNLPAADALNPNEDKQRPPRIEALMSLVAGIAHELGNPLNSISIHLQLLKRELSDIPAKKQKILERAFDVLSSETSRLDKIVKNFLKAARKSPLRFRSEDINEILTEVLQLLRPELERNRIRVHFHPEPAIPDFLMDRSRIYQAFTNLVKNAMEAMPKGGELRISFSRKDNVAILQFRDSGAGIPEKDLPHIFEAYYTTKEEGSGLGLMTVFSAVRDHGGRIEVTSKVSKGTTFTLLIPVRLDKLQLPMPKSKTA